MSPLVFCSLNVVSPPRPPVPSVRSPGHPKAFYNGKVSRTKLPGFFEALVICASGHGVGCWATLKVPKLEKAGTIQNLGVRICYLFYT